MAQQGEIRYAGIDIEPNSPDQKLLDDFYALYDSLPDVPSAADLEELYKKQDAMLEASPRIGVLIKQNHQAIFSDPTMKSIMAQIDAAKDVLKQYYEIPRFTRLSVEDGELVQDALNEAADMVKLGKASSQKTAIRMIYKEGRLTAKEYGVAMNANRLGVRNRQRAIFWKANADVLEWYSDIPVELAPTP